MTPSLLNAALQFDPQWPWPVIAALGLACVGVLILHAYYRRKGLMLRALAFAMIIAGLMNPTLTNEDRHRLPSIVALVDDQTASQSLQNRKADTVAAIAALDAKLKAIDGVEVRHITVTGEGTDGTMLFGDVQRGLADVPPNRLAGVIAVTDGEVHDLPASPAASGLTAPFHALITGSPDELDRRVIIKAAPRFGLVGSTQTITFKVEDIGAKQPGAPVPITIRVDGVEVDRRTITADRETQLDIKIAHAGQNIIEIQTDPLQGDLTPLNDRAVAVVEGIRQNLKVLLVSGEPNAGERTWRNLLKSDTAVDLIHFTILRPPEKQDNTPPNELSLIPFPTRELFSEKIKQFDLIIFDRYQRKGVLPALYFDNIAQYIEQGGAVLIVAGPDDLGPDSIYNTPLGAVLPAEPNGSAHETPFIPTVTDLGRKHPVTRDLPGSEANPPKWSPWFRTFDSTVQAGQTVMTGADGLPLLVLSHQGEGRIAMLMSDDVWLWARQYDGGGPYLPLLRRLAHWLVHEPDLEEDALKLSVDAGALVITRQTLGDTVPPVSVTKPDGSTVSVTLKAASAGQWRQAIDAAEPGLYSATDGTHRALINIGPANPREYAELSSTTALLKPIAEATGGVVQRLHPVSGAALTVPQVLGLENGHSFGGTGWLGLKLTDAYEVRGVLSVHLANGLLAVGLLLAALGLMWWREGK